MKVLGSFNSHQYIPSTVHQEVQRGRWYKPGIRYFLVLADDKIHVISLTTFDRLKAFLLRFLWIDYMGRAVKKNYSDLHLIELPKRIMLPERNNPPPVKQNRILILEWNEAKKQVIFLHSDGFTLNGEPGTTA